MHPILAKYTRLTVYLLAWVPIAGMLVYLLGLSGHLTYGEAAAIVIPLAGFDAFICLSPWYLCRTLPPRASGAFKLLFNLLGAALASGLLLVIAGKGLALVLVRWWPRIDTHFSHPHLLPLVFSVGVLMYLLAIALHYVLLSVEESQQAATRESEALVLAREAELRALRAQINPHFLFNSLNSISALTTVDPSRAREMCILLSDFLRKTLSAGDQDTITLADEVALIRTYLAVEQIRFGARLAFDIDVDETCNRCLLPPLLLQPLIENAIKHGVSGLTEGGVIGVRARANERFLRLTVENNFDTGYRALRRSGIGLANVRSRLEARYDGDARMDAGPQGDRYRVEIVMPVNLAAAPAVQPQTQPARAERA
jgi:hypothetical protein